MSFTEEQFYASITEFVDGYTGYFPVPATVLGIHRSDDRLGDYSPDGIAQQRAWLDSWLERFEHSDTSGWSVDGQIDCAMMASFVRRAINGRLTFGYNNYNWLRRNPATFVYEGIYGIYALALHPQDGAAFVQSVVSRLRHVPRVLAEGRALIDPPAVPQVWAAIAAELAHQGVRLFGGLLPQYAEAVPPPFREAFLGAAQAAAGALQEYGAWVQQQVLPHAAGDYALGAEAVNAILRDEHLVDYDVETLLATGRRHCEELSAQLAELCASIDPTKTRAELLKQALHERPAADALLDTYRDTIGAARQFLLDHDLVSLPAGDSLVIETTPPLLRTAIPFAATKISSIFGAFQSTFAVTPLAPEPTGSEEKLLGHASAQIPVTVVHEVYPGHHLHVSIAQQQESLPRKLGGFLFPTTLGGWAWYVEEMMEQQGFLTSPFARLSRLQSHLVGASWCVVEAALHTRQMTIEQAIGFMIQLGIDPTFAKTAVPHSLLLPTDPQTDLMGKLEIRAIVEEYRRRNPEAPLREVHDAVLSCGLVGPRLIRQRLFGAA